MEDKKTAQNVNNILGSTKNSNDNYPKFSPKSQCAEILQYLRQYGSMTHYDALKLGIMGFNARIYDLRKAGYKVPKTKETMINKHGKSVERWRFTLVE